MTGGNFANGAAFAAFASVLQEGASYASNYSSDDAIASVAKAKEDIKNAGPGTEFLDGKLSVHRVDGKPLTADQVQEVQALLDEISTGEEGAEFLSDAAKGNGTNGKVGILLNDDQLVKFPNMPRIDGVKWGYFDLNYQPGLEFDVVTNTSFRPSLARVFAHELGHGFYNTRDPATITPKGFSSNAIDFENRIMKPIDNYIRACGDYCR